MESLLESLRRCIKKFDDPWHQSEDGMFNNLSRKVVCHFIKYQIKTSIEFGCGLGNTMSFIQKETNIETLGVDISETSIRKAKKYPKMSFEVNNIKNILDYSQFQCFSLVKLHGIYLKINC